MCSWWINSNLHSTMLLLYLIWLVYSSDSVRNLHSTMLLLYLTEFIMLVGIPASFTFHYASTLSIMVLIFMAASLIYIPLCFYFILRLPSNTRGSVFIYIPLCFYFISNTNMGMMQGFKFTFHYASTLSKTNIVKNMEKDHLHSTMLLLYLMCAG